MDGILGTHSQGVRFTISPQARTDVLDKLLARTTTAPAGGRAQPAQQEVPPRLQEEVPNRPAGTQNSVPG